MAATGMSMREILVNIPYVRRLRELLIRSGGDGQSVETGGHADRAGGQAFKDSHKAGSITRSRFLYWKISGDTLELTDHSLDYNLTNNMLKLCFGGSPVLDTISVHEAFGHVIILVATTTSVHRLVFPHPTKLHKLSTESTAVSIFNDASLKSITDAAGTYILGSSSAQEYHVHLVASQLTNSGDAVFSLATNSGSILLVTLPPIGVQGVAKEVEMRHSSVMQWLWTGLVPTVMRGRKAAADVVTSLCMLPAEQDILIYSVCRDHKLRVWSVRNQACVMAANLLEYVPAKVETSQTNMASEGHLIRKTQGGSVQGQLLVVYLRFTERTQFVVLQPNNQHGKCRLTHLANIFGSEDVLSDYCVSATHIWGVFASQQEGDLTVKYTPLQREGTSLGVWDDVIVQEPEPRELDHPAGLDLRQAYLEHIFQPGRFAAQAILKALQIYSRHSLDPSQMPSVMDMSLLKSEVAAAVEFEIHHAASEYEMAEEEYRHLQLQKWVGFYSLCVQYQEVSRKSIGLFTDTASGLTAVIGKDSVSYLRPCEAVEHLYLTPPDYCVPTDFQDEEVFNNDQGLCRDVISLFEAVKVIQETLTPAAIASFEHDLYNLQTPEQVAEDLVDEMLIETSTSGVLEAVSVRMQNIEDPVRALDAILTLLDLSEMNGDQSAMEDKAVEAAKKLWTSRLFGSNAGIDAMSLAVTQLVETRLAASRDLLLLLVVMLRIGEQAHLTLDTNEHIQTTLLPKAGLLTRAYYVMKLCCSTLTSPNSPSSLETNLRQLAALELEYSTLRKVAVADDKGGVALSSAYLHQAGWTVAITALADSRALEDEVLYPWTSLVCPAVLQAAQLLWPLSSHLLFAEFLMTNCQYVALQDYLRCTRSWCDWYAAARDFLMGRCLLYSQEAEKAADLFVEASQGVILDDYMLSKVLKTDESDPQRVLTLYFLKVIALFEEGGYPEQVVSVARTAIEMADPEDHNVATLWSKVFKHELEQGHNNEAYDAMISNPELERRKDCLRQFVVVLCERNQLQALVEFPYTDLQDEVVGIIESRARSVDLTAHNFYDLLYSFHVFRGNYRKAGSIMYEYGMRLGHEVPGVKGLQRQAKCYLAAMNALRLVDPKYAWIVKPVHKKKGRVEENLFGKSPKHDLEGEELDSEGSERKMEVLELADLEKEYMLVHGRLQLVQKDSDPTHAIGPTASADETIALMVNAGMFDSAINICKLFNMPLTPVFEGLTSRCVKLSMYSGGRTGGADNELTGEAWSWLADNELGSGNTGRDISSADQSWRLLQRYLSTYEQGKQSIYHKAVCIRLFSQGFLPPNWFIASYKVQNPAELLRLYIDYDLLEEAAELAIEYIDAVSGKGYEYFGLQTFLHHGAPSVWLPYTCIDQLLYALQEGQDDAQYHNLYQSLRHKMNEYLTLVEKTSQATLRAGYQRAAVS